MKICSNCKVNKELNNYHKRSKSVDKLDYWCKKCKKDKEQSYNFIPSYGGNKICTTCNNIKLKFDYHKCKRNKDGLENRCKSCCKIRSRKNEIEKYGIDKAIYENMLRNQNGECKICKSSNPGNGKNNMLIDHCHITQKVRGLLCIKCNFAIGLMMDDPKLLIKAAEYLDESTTTN